MKKFEEEEDEVKVISTREIIPVEVAAGVDAATGTGNSPDVVCLPAAVVHGKPRHPEPRAIHQNNKKTKSSSNHLRSPNQTCLVRGKEAVLSTSPTSTCSSSLRMLSRSQ
ncbi:hypothetical protein EYF80_043785 [Liparis tanakae]|uniref:Uncharacterized protein n=1 Tax=Liparis tanakae TaxID=230148 RepID=A0A4Z2FXT2_9TELE|nr:hypothetical protein EYF80_043785 [Liparis tanakae]